ncbi:D-aminoacyl-tRNA deacylase [uncultured Helcococcus sp.]|uniref:D-aminoacyl-tRNA deacylase n=1 Tax=uncultured Helcococcus sp. TaxID=1072508 RepID=UPI002621B594|nr:D-aminoacyl-tRNA deacylase [uncultured Helcococcus sp.]
MRALVQRVKKVDLSVDGELYSKINQGLLVFLGVSNEDDTSDIDYLIRKITGLRIFSDEDDKMNLSVKDTDGEIMLVSQFTLYGDVRKGFRPSFSQSANGEKAEDLYLEFVERLKNEFPKVQTGKFAADMQISLINDGPVTIQIDSKKEY